MATYAAVVSLSNTLQQVQTHSRASTYFDKKQVESLCGKLAFLQEFLENYFCGGGEAARDLEKQILSVAYTIEEMIESHVADQILGGSTDHSTSSMLDLHEELENMDSVGKKAVDIKDMMRTVEEQSQLRFLKEPETSSGRDRPICKTAMVGFEDELIEIREKLTRGQSSRLAIPIIGMGGIGKTTLARSVFDNSHIVYYFDIRVWVTVSQEYTLQDMLWQIPFCQQKLEDSDDALGEDELGEMLYKSLSGNRYLIVLDDTWSIEAWNVIKRFLPENKNMSRVVVTTRLTNVASQFGSYSCQLNFLDEDESWKLFCDCVFAEEDCPPELEKVGKEIVAKCKGLPLSIAVMGGLLAKSCRTQEYWKSVAIEMSSSTLNSGDNEYCLNVLSLSYKQLPIHLKPCFLYMGIFPEGEEIRVSQLIKLWVAEGFLKSSNAKSQEEVAEDYFKDLVDRNLVRVHGWKWNGSIRTCSVHHLLHDLCLRIGTKEFFCMRKMYENHDIKDAKYRIASRFHSFVHENYGFCMRKIYENCEMEDTKYHTASRFHSFVDENYVLSYADKLQRVLQNIEGRPHDIFKRVNLRYVSYRCNNLNWLLNLPSLISSPWNLQTLICDHINVEIVAPIEIWDMKQLRHVKFPNIYLPSPPSSHDGEIDKFVFRNLQTLQKVINFKWSEEALKRIPYLKKLKAKYKELGPTEDFCLNNLCYFHRLESLQVDLRRCRKTRRNLSLGLKLSQSLKKLTLEHSGLCWDDMSMIGSLPCLEVFIHKGIIIGHEWNPIEGEFCSLKSLDVERCDDLTFWHVESDHFPVLKKFRFGHAPNLNEIPLSIGEIPTLRAISLIWCGASAAVSAMKILEEQESNGNKDFKVRVLFKSYVEEDRFKAMAESEGLTSNNFHIEIPQI